MMGFSHLQMDTRLVLESEIVCGASSFVAA